MILKFNTIGMEDNYYKDKLFEKTLSVVKNNIDEEDIKRQIYSVNISQEDSVRPDYIKIELNPNEYDEVLERIMNYFIKHEWYEDCVEIKEYQDKLKKLQNNNNNEQTTRTKTSTVKAEL